VRERTGQAIELSAHDDVDLAPACNLHERIEAGAAFLCATHAMVHVLVELPPSGPAVRPELFHLRGRILIGGGDARVDPGGHEPRLVDRTKTRSHGRPSPFCLRFACDLVCGHRPPHTGRGWKLRETMTRVVRLAGVEPATLGLEVLCSLGRRHICFHVLPFPGVARHSCAGVRLIARGCDCPVTLSVTQTKLPARCPETANETPVSRA